MKDVGVMIRKGQINKSIIIIGSVVVMMVAFATAMLVGAAEISFQDIWQALFTTKTNDEILIIREIRFPREVAAILIGAALSVAGSIMQGITRNPLADPGLLGLSAGANAMIAILFAFLPSSNYFQVMIAAFLGAAFGAVLVFGLSAMKKGGFSPFRIVLAGSAVSALLYAIADGVKIFFKISKDVSLWTSGGLIGTSWGQIRIAAPMICFGILIAILLSRQITILSLSEEVATGLGQKTVVVKVVLFVVIILLTGASVALAGNMAFIGLIIPHIVRGLVGQDYRFILPMSVTLGASFLLLADTLGRMINAPYETPVNAIVSMMGLPFFLLLMKKGVKSI